MLRAVTTRQPEWTEQDQAELLALAEYRESLCPYCRRPTADCQASTEVAGARFDVSRRICQTQRALLEMQKAVFDAETEGGKKQPPISAGARVWQMSVRPPPGR